jgi:hypothetical protein
MTRRMRFWVASKNLHHETLGVVDIIEFVYGGCIDRRAVEQAVE